MGFDVIDKVISQILEEELPPNCHPILCLAKTDEERLKAKKKDLEESSDDKIQSQTTDQKKRREWIRQSYKFPLAHAGINKNIGSTDKNAQIEAAREKRLKSLALRGTVALFNAVREHQNTINTQCSNSKLSDMGKEAVLSQVTTSDFLDRLSSGISGTISRKKSKK